MQPDTHFIRFNMEILYLKRFIEKSLFPLLSGSHVILQHINSSQACSISRANLFNIITRLSEVHPTVCTGIIETRLLSQKKKKKKRKSQNRGELVLAGQWKDCGDRNGTPKRLGGLDTRGRTQHWCTPESGQRSSSASSPLLPLWNDQAHLEFQSSSSKWVLSLNGYMGAEVSLL